MGLVMLVSLYTVRVVLNTLGKVDYGIYNVVGGIVVMFSFLSNTMAVAAQRFFSYELGKGKHDQLKKTFSAVIVIYVLMAIIIGIMAETLGLWFLNTQMNIPVDRLEAARWVYHFSVFSFLATILKSPYDAVIMSRENMKVYAYISVVDVVLKLVIVYLLLLFQIDKLKLYATLVFAVTIINVLIYWIYCRRKYPESRFSFIWDKALFKTLLSYSGLNMLGSVAMVANNQGLNILLNVFFGPVVNAARGIAYQINYIISQLTQNFMTAVRPQIIKYYATQEREQMFELIFRSTKFSYFLLSAIAMPLLLETHFILALWLKNPPEYTVIFTRLIIVMTVIESFSYPLMTSAQAAIQHFKKYMLTISAIMILNLPISYAFLKLGFQPQVVFYISIINTSICLLVRLYLLRSIIGLHMRTYIRKVFFPVITTTLLSVIIPLIIIHNFEEGLIRFIMSVIVGGIVSVTIIYFIGITNEERNFIFRMIKNKFKKNN